MKRGNAVEIAVDGVEVTGPHGPLLRATSLHVSTGQVTLVTGTPGTERTALALALSGRLRPARGTVRLDGKPAGGALRRRVAVVDIPGVTEPDGCLPVSDVVAEGLSLAGRRSGRRQVRTWLGARGLSAHAGGRFENLGPTDRTRLLLDLAREGRGVRGLVLDSPDRHGGTPLRWYSAATGAARSGYAVAVLCSPHSAGGLDLPAARIGHDNGFPDERAYPFRAQPNPPDHAAARGPTDSTHRPGTTP